MKVSRILTTTGMVIGAATKLLAQATNSTGMDGFSFPLITVLVLIVLVLFLLLREMVALRKRVDALDAKKEIEWPNAPDIELPVQDIGPLVQHQLDALKNKLDSLFNKVEADQKFLHDLEDQLEEQAKNNTDQQAMILTLEDGLIVLKENTKPAVHSLSGESQEYIKVAIENHFQLLGKELEHGLIAKLNLALANVSRVAPLELGKMYFVDKPPRVGQFNHELFLPTWSVGKSVYKIVVDAADDNRAYLSLNEQDTVSYERAWQNYEQFIGPLFNLVKAGEDKIIQPAVLKRKKDIWVVEKKGAVKAV